MGSRQILFASLFAAAVSAFSTINRHHSDLPASVTAVLAKAAGLKYFGAATDNPELINTTYASVLYDNSIFEQQTPGNSQKVIFEDHTL